MHKTELIGTTLAGIILLSGCSSAIQTNSNLITEKVPLSSPTTEITQAPSASPTPKATATEQATATIEATSVVDKYAIDSTKLNQFFKSYDDLMTNYMNYQEQPNPLTDKTGWDASMIELKKVFGPPSEMGVCITSSDAFSFPEFGITYYDIPNKFVSTENTKVTNFLDNGNPIPIIWCNISGKGLHGLILFDGVAQAINTRGIGIIDVLNDRSDTIKEIYMFGKVDSSYPKILNDLIEIGLYADAFGYDPEGVSVGPAMFQTTSGD